MSKEIPYKIYLSEKEIPTQWYNLRRYETKKPAPLRNQDGTICSKEDLAKVFCDDLVDQELNTTDPYIDIPEGIRDLL